MLLMFWFFAEFDLDKSSRPDQSVTEIPNFDTMKESRVMIQNVV
jgi:hypothetical protein